MKSKPTRIARLLYIHALLRDGKCPSCRALKDRLSVGLRTIYRDLAVLRYQLNAPLAYNHARHSYYYTVPGWNVFEIG